MKTGSARLWAAALLCVSLGAGSVYAPSSPVQELLISGEAVCGTAGPVGRYQLNWTVINPEVNGTVRILSARESGAFEGEVDISPNPLPPGANGAGSDGPVPGMTRGTVVLTVEFLLPGQVRGRSTGAVQLDGDCVVPRQPRR